MSLSARAIALQGFGFGALQIGLQGLLVVEQVIAEVGPGQPVFASRRVRDEDLEEILELVKAALKAINKRTLHHDPIVPIH